jgi:hypothetical protein
MSHAQERPAAEPAALQQEQSSTTPDAPCCNAISEEGSNTEREVTLDEDERVGKPPTANLPAPPRKPTAAQRRRMREARMQVASRPPPSELRVGEDEWCRPIVSLSPYRPEGLAGAGKGSIRDGIRTLC